MLRKMLSDFVSFMIVINVGLVYVYKCFFLCDCVFIEIYVECMNSDLGIGFFFCSCYVVMEIWLMQVGV